jgi:hypothetical protein
VVDDGEYGLARESIVNVMIPKYPDPYEVPFDMEKGGAGYVLRLDMDEEGWAGILGAGR